jgi:hypothetical protein
MSRVEIGPYRLLRRVKEGGGGTVYVATDLRLNRRVALKFISVPRDRDARDRVIAEARSLAAVNHRSIVQIFDVVEVKSHIVLVMEYVPGLDLEELLRRGGVDLVSVLYLALDICAALAAAHEAGLVHRDLKPANILLQPNGRTKLTDFGIASAMFPTGDADADRQQSVAGSYSCMSPEHAGGLPVDQRSDLFALGILLYRLLADRHPFAGHGDDHPSSQPHGDETHQPLSESNDDVPVLVSELVDQLLEKNPQARPSTALAVRQKIMFILRGLPVTRGRPLSSLMTDMVRVDELVATRIHLPAGVSRGARSHLLSTRDWGPWAVDMRSALVRSGLVVLATFVLTGLVYGANEWWQANNVGIGLRPPVMRVSEGTATTPQAEQLMHFLHTAIEEHPRLRVRSEPVQTMLSMLVQCNPHVCGLQLTRTDNTGSYSNYQALLPGSAESQWEEGVTRSVTVLFEGY